MKYLPIRRKSQNHNFLSAIVGNLYLMSQLWKGLGLRYKWEHDSVVLELL